VPDLASESDNSATEKLQSTANFRGTQRTLRGQAARNRRLEGLLADFGDAMREPGDFPLRRIAMNDAVTGCTD
jgi:hypothetical protein